MPLAKVNSLWRYVFCSVKEEGKKKRERERGKGIKRSMKTKLSFCLVNCGCIVLPWTQLQRGRKSIFSHYSTAKRENLFVKGIKPKNSMSACLLRTRKISHRYNYIIQQRNWQPTLPFQSLVETFFFFFKETPMAKCHLDCLAGQRINTSVRILEEKNLQSPIWDEWTSNFLPSLLVHQSVIMIG